MDELFKKKNQNLKGILVRLSRSALLAEHQENRMCLFVLPTIFSNPRFDLTSFWLLPSPPPGHLAGGLCGIRAAGPGLWPPGGRHHSTPHCHLPNPEVRTTRTSNIY